MIVKVALALTLSWQASQPSAVNDLSEHQLTEVAGDTFSGVIAVRRGYDLTIISRGLADHEHFVPNHPDTVFKIGSLTKQFTAAALLTLVDDGKLSLDDGLCIHVQPCPSKWNKIKIRQLLNHQSGIQDFVRMPGAFERFVQPTQLSDTLDRLRSVDLEFEPGTDANYGNSGYLIAAHIIERYSGLTFDEYLERAIYEPLSMKNSGYAWNSKIITNRARGYTRRNGDLSNATYIDMSVPVGAGSQYSTALDLLKWDAALRNNRLLSDKSRREMFSSSHGEYGLGWTVTRRAGRIIHEHNGDIFGFGSFIARWPDNDAVIIILSNIEGTDVLELERSIESLLFP